MKQSGKNLKSGIFLDRDGVINKAIVRNSRPYSPISVEEIEILDGVAEGLDLLRGRGFELIVVTNQPDIARGSMSEGELKAIHDYIGHKLAIKYFWVCPHDDRDSCLCRKPKPGLLIESASNLDINLKSSFMIGDRWKDVEAGTKAGVRNLFIDYGYDEPQPIGDFRLVHSLLDAAHNILEELDA
jgi:D-glycero-D-manno-heptose 1,7-bisphosphate phosphatase